MGIARRLGGALAAIALAPVPTISQAADAPRLLSIADRASGAVLWSAANATSRPSLKPGQAILLQGRNFGPGPLTSARPGLDPPAGGLPPAHGGASIRSPPPDG